jgi:hypothetical protein
MGTVIVALRDVYGVTRAYPVNDTALAFALLVGQKTLSNDHLRVIKGLGFTVEVQQQSLAL